jgi:hypothetical protein
MSRQVVFLDNEGWSCMYGENPREGRRVLLLVLLGFRPANQREIYECTKLKYVVGKGNSLTRLSHSGLWVHSQQIAADGE